MVIIYHVLSLSTDRVITAIRIIFISLLLRQAHKVKQLVMHWWQLPPLLLLSLLLFMRKAIISNENGCCYLNININDLLISRCWNLKTDTIYFLIENRYDWYNCFTEYLNWEMLNWVSLDIYHESIIKMI